MKLDKRLSCVAQLVPASDVLADIGSDHAYLPAYLLLSGRIKRAIVSDVNRGPLENGEKTCRSLGIYEKCDFRLGSGLDVLSENEADVITMCGMGGELMTNLLSVNINTAKSAGYLILQPQSAYDLLRKFLYENGFGVIDERTVRDRHLFYRVILASTDAPCVKDDFLYPSFSAERKDPVYEEFLRFRLELNNNIIKKISASSSMEGESVPAEMENERIKEVLKYYENK